MINLNPFINLISSVISIYSFCLIIYVILHYLFLFKILNPHNEFVQRVYQFLIRIIEPALSKIRRYVPIIAGIDVSILVLFLGLYLIRDILYTYLYV